MLSVISQKAFDKLELNFAGVFSTSVTMTRTRIVQKFAFLLSFLYSYIQRESENIDSTHKFFYLPIFFVSSNPSHIYI